LLPTKKHTRKILDLLHEGVAFVGPRGHYVSLQRYIGSNQEDVRVTLTRLYGEDRAGQILDAPEKHGYFAGSMFWARLDGIESMLNIMPIPEDFEAEAGQIDGTYAHALERMFTLMPVVEGKRIYESSPRGLYATELNAPTWEYPYAP